MAIASVCAREDVKKFLIAFLAATSIVAACASNAQQSKARKGAKSGAAIGAGIGLFLGILSGDSDVAAAAVAVGAASGAVRGGYEGWRQDQDDERTRQITAAIRESSVPERQVSMDTDDRQREELTRFLGVWELKGWMQEPGEGRINVSSRVDGNVHMTYFVEMAFVDFKAEGFDDQIWGSTTLGYNRDSGFELSTRFSTVPDSIDVSGGRFDAGSRSFEFSDATAITVIRFQTPDRFHLTTTMRDSGEVVESSEFTRT